MTIKSTGPFIALGIALVSAPLSSYAFIFYNAEAIEGWVADAETGKPIEGVIVRPGVPRSPLAAFSEVFGANRLRF